MEKYINLKYEKSYDLLKYPAAKIRNGGIVIFPTETVYGIGVSALDENAIENLYSVKKRDYNKATSVLVSNKEMIKMVAEDISKKEEKIIDSFFPGPLTIILNKKKNISQTLTAHKNTIGVRMPDNEVALKLIDCVGMPIATSSANISNEPNQTNINYLLAQFENKVDFFIDGGESKIGIASTIVQIIDDEVKILRERKH